MRRVIREESGSMSYARDWEPEEDEKGKQIMNGTMVGWSEPPPLETTTASSSGGGEGELGNTTAVEGLMNGATMVKEEVN